MYITELPSKLSFQFTFLPAMDESGRVFREHVRLQGIEYIVNVCLILTAIDRQGHSSYI